MFRFLNIDNTIITSKIKLDFRNLEGQCMYINRNIENTILNASRQYPVVMVCGQRQVGKSTMLNHIKEEKRKYVSLDDINARRLAETDPDLLFDTYGIYLIIDEFQRVPSILLKIKDIVDKKSYAVEDNKGMFWLTCSQKFVMMKNISELLAGRVAVFEMSSLSQREINGVALDFINLDINLLRHCSYSSKTVGEVYEAIFNGGMPDIIAQGLDRERYYSDYITTYLERDIRTLEQVTKLNEFYDFLVYMAAHTAQELCYDSISKSIGVSAPTAKSWVVILERSGIIYILHSYYSNVTKRLVKTPKFYFLDTGLAAFLCRWPNAETLQNGAMDGAFFETYVVSEIVKSYYNLGKPITNLYYYRDIDQKEIDLLVMNQNSITPIEIKKSALPTDADKNFEVLRKFQMEIDIGLVICMTKDLVPLNKTCWLCPITII